MQKYKVLVVATSRKTHGGVTSVVRAHESGPQWAAYRCYWIETHRDGSKWVKLAYFVKSLLRYFFMVPFCDLVHIHTATYVSLCRKTFFLCLAKLWRKKVIVHFHPLGPSVLFRKDTQAAYRRFFRAADRVVVLSPQWQRWVHETLGLTDHIVCIYNPSPTADLSAPLPAKEKFILFAGTLIWRKGFNVLIEAFGRIAARHPDWKVVLAGLPMDESDARLMEELPRRFGIESQVVYPGWVTGEAKDDLFKRASVFCLPSEEEGFPMAVLDAWAYGLPVVCTPVGGLPDIVEEGRNALLFDYGDVDRLAEQLDRIIADDALRESIGREALVLARTTFNIENINRQIGDLYREVLDGK